MSRDRSKTPTTPTCFFCLVEQQSPNQLDLKALCSQDEYRSIPLLSYSSSCFDTTMTKNSPPLSLQSTVTVPSTPPTRQPRLGWGSWPSKGTTCTNSVLTAISLGYRHFDSAQAYRNEEAIGDAVRQTDVPRSKLYLTSKIHIDDADPPKDVEEVYKGIEESVKKMNGGRDGGYLDLMLIHGAAVDGGKHNEVQWKALERAYKDKLVKAIGVSNAGKGLIEAMKSYAQVWPPHVNQIEVCLRRKRSHPRCTKRISRQLCRTVLAWRGRSVDEAQELPGRVPYGAKFCTTRYQRASLCLLPSLASVSL